MKDIITGPKTRAEEIDEMAEKAATLYLEGDHAAAKVVKENFLKKATGEEIHLFETAFKKSVYEQQNLREMHEPNESPMKHPDASWSGQAMYPGFARNNDPLKK